LCQIDLAQRVGLDVVVQDEEWGTGASPEHIEEALRADHAHTIKGVLIACGNRCWQWS